MPTRREQLQGYRFVTRRIVSAMLSGEPESSMLPMRRLGLGIFASFMIATIVFGGVGVYGVLVPGGKDSWRADGTFIIERETGARYIYDSRALHPILNYTTARLLIGGSAPQEVSAASLRDTPRGAAYGIRGAPDSLPATSALLGPPWVVCSSPRTDESDVLATELMVGRSLPGGAGLGERGLIVTEGTSTGTTYLLWHNVRYKIPDKVALTSLELTDVPAAVVGTAMLGAIPEGPDLAVPTIAGRGDPGRTINGTRYKIGDVFRSGTVDYVLLSDGLATIHHVMAKLLLAGGTPIDLSAGAIAKQLSDHRFERTGFPADVPSIEPVPGSQPAICAAYQRGTAGSVSLRIYQQAPAALLPTDTPKQASSALDAGPVADNVVVPGGHGAVVREETEPGVTAGTTIYLVTDQGRKYPLVKSGRTDAVALLGYSAVRPVPVPTELLALVPTGPALDATAANHAVTATVPSPTASPDKQPD